MPTTENMVTPGSIPAAALHYILENKLVAHYVLSNPATLISARLSVAPAVLLWTKLEPWPGYPPQEYGSHVTGRHAGNVKADVEK